MLENEYAVRPLRVIEYKEPERFLSAGKEHEFPNVVQMKNRPLRPAEYELLRAQASPSFRTYLDGFLLSGMRPTVYGLLIKNPDWFDGRSIQVPRWAVRKKRATVRQRTVQLSIRGRAVFETLWSVIQLDDIPATEAGMKYRLQSLARKAGIKIEGLTPKSFRKMTGSWLFKLYPTIREEILLSMGHDEVTAMRHYLNFDYTESDVLQMAEWFSGFGK